MTLHGLDHHGRTIRRFAAFAGGVHASRVGESQASGDWDGATYDRVADPQERWARRVLDRLELRAPRPSWTPAAGADG
jgi:hypothetical protein